MNPPVVKNSSQTSVKAEQNQAPTLQLWDSIRTVIGFQNQAPPLTPISGNNQLPLSFPQERLWLLEQLNPGNSAYNIPFAFRITGALNLSALKQAIQKILMRHEALRTNFVNQQGQPRQIIANSIFKLSVIDLKNLSPDEQASQTKELINTTAQRPFDLNKESLFRSQLLQLGEQEYILLLCIHHIVFDGWSQGILFQELSELYTAFCKGEPNPLQPLAIQYPDFAHWQRQWLQGDFLQVLLNYWQQNLGDNLRELQLPIDYPQPTNPTRRSSYQKISFNEELTASLKNLSCQEGATLFTTLLAAFQVLLWRYTQQENLFVCSPIANRNRKEIKSLIGYLVNLLILRGNLAANLNFRDFLKQLRQQVSGAYAHQDLPINCLDFLLIPISQVMFTLQNTPSKSLDLPNLGVEVLETDSGTADFDLFLSLEEDGGKLMGTLKYNTDLFASTSIIQILKNFHTILEQIVANPEQNLADLLPFSEAQQQELAQKRANRQLAEVSAQCITYVAPRNNLELRLKNIWEKILAIQPIGVKDDFLALGGKSLMAIRLLAEIQTEFDQKLSFINLLQAPTIEQMARLLAQTGYSIPWSPLVPIQESGSKLPLFLVAPGATTALHFLDLARHLGPQQPVYAFHSKGLETDEVPHTTIEEIAAYYIEAMQSLDFDGPYLIGGRCGIGTVVAYEMAQQLLSAGKQVNLLVMLDPTYEAFRNAFKQPHLHFMEELPEKNFAYYIKQVKLHWEHQELHKILWRKTGIPSLQKKLHKLFNRPNSSSSEMLPHKCRIQTVFRQHDQAANQYLPSKFPGKIILFLSDYRVSFGLWRYQNWHELATKGLERHIFPGHHSYLLREPQVQPLAEKLKTYIDKAQEHPWWSS